MAWYLRKAFRLGPVRLNVSKSGLGASLGVLGLRVGSGPRGPYLHAGRGGLYYRQSLSPGRRAPARGESLSPELEAIESSDVGELVSAETEDALAAYNEVLQRWALWPWTIGLAVGCAFVFAATGAGTPWAWGAIGLVLALLVGISIRRDLARLRFDMQYQLEPAQARPYEGLVQAFDPVAGSARVWHVSAEGSTGDRRKYHAGAGTLVQRTIIHPSMSLPPRLRSALTFPTLRAGAQTLHFLPDCLLVIDGRRAGALTYADVRGSIGTTRFIESDTPPPDGTQVGQTWTYVNKQGGPDRRFRDNPELPILEYGTLRLASTSGLMEDFQASRADVFPGFLDSILEMAKHAAHTESLAARPSRFKTREEYEAWKAQRAASEAPPP